MCCSVFPQASHDHRSVLCWCIYIVIILQCVAVCCSMLQCVAVCCSVLQCVAVCRSMLFRIPCLFSICLLVSLSTLTSVSAWHTLVVHPLLFSPPFHHPSLLPPFYFCHKNPKITGCRLYGFWMDACGWPWRYSMSQFGARRFSFFIYYCVAAWCSVVHCDALWCGLLQCVSV